MPRGDPPDPATQRSRQFPEAAAVHRRVLADPDAYPQGWVEQARFRERNDLPPFRPPRFRDGTRVRETVRALEAQFGVDVSFVARDVRADGWVVEVDGRRAFAVEQYRDDAANTVIETAPGAFEGAVRDAARGGPNRDADE